MDRPFEPCMSASSSHPQPLPSEVLFLDFDGVLQTPGVEGWREMEHCEGLEALLNLRPSLHVVVASSHREGRTVADVRLMLHPAIAHRVMDVTPVLPLGRANGGRQLEIEAWLAQHPSVTKWASVDDEAFLYSQNCDWLVRTHPRIGWCKGTTNQLLEIFTGKTGQPMMTGTRSAPKFERTRDRCLPSTNSSPDEFFTSTGNGGQSFRSPLLASVNHLDNAAKRPSSGKPGTSLASRVSTLASIWTTWTGARTKS